MTPLRSGRRGPWVARAALLGLVAAGAPACRARTMDVLRPAGPQAERIADLWGAFFLITAAVEVLVLAALVWSVTRPRHDAADLTPDVAESDADFRGGAPLQARVVSRADDGSVRKVVFSLTGLTAAILLGLLVTSAVTGHALAAMRDETALEVEVVGHQWWWELRYPGPNPSLTVVTANELHLPVGRKVMIDVSSSDVIHSFWVPSLHGKIDAIPAHHNLTFLSVDAPGVYEGRCAEFCGFQHAHMQLRVVAETPEQFEAWLAGQRAPAAEPETEQAKQGKQVFLSGPCVMCHTVNGTLAQGKVGPNLTHLASRTTIAAGTLPNNRGSLAGWIVNAQGPKPGNHMPAIALDPGDLQAVLAYLEGLK